MMQKSECLRLFTGRLSVGVMLSVSIFLLNGCVAWDYYPDDSYSEPVVIHHEDVQYVPVPVQTMKNRHIHHSRPRMIPDEPRHHHDKPRVDKGHHHDDKTKPAPLKPGADRRHHDDKTKPAPLKPGADKGHHDDKSHIVKEQPKSIGNDLKRPVVKKQPEFEPVKPKEEKPIAKKDNGHVDKKPTDKVHNEGKKNISPKEPNHDLRFVNDKASVRRNGLLSHNKKVSKNR